jgi:serine/threonine protein phosphatase PrpC
MKKIAESLLDSLLSPNIQRTLGKGCDNMTVIIVEFSS